MISTRSNAMALAGFVTLVLVVELVAGLATQSSVDSWYPSLQKAPWNPPGWVFGPVWTLLYVSMAVAAWRVWQRRTSNGLVTRALRLFYVQLTLNFLWSIIFFGLKNPALGLIDILLLLAAVVVTARDFMRVDRTAGWIMVPYAAWVAFASTLNGAIWWLNP